MAKINEIWERGSFTLPSNQTSVDVAFTRPLPIGATVYLDICKPSWQTSVWITSETYTGFSYNVGTPNEYSQNIKYFVLSPVI